MSWNDLLTAWLQEPPPQQGYGVFVGDQPYDRRARAKPPSDKPEAQDRIRPSRGRTALTCFLPLCPSAATAGSCSRGRSSWRLHSSWNEI